MWQFTGNQRPSFAIEPLESQESVWDYPRPPICVEDQRQVKVCIERIEIALSDQAIRVLETASPPTVYIPSTDVNLDFLARSNSQSFCEWKGAATYWHFRSGEYEIKNCAWSYENPGSRFEKIAGHFSFYPSLLECWLGDERVRPQSGGFYGGWITSEIVGPWKGEHGTGGW